MSDGPKHVSYYILKYLERMAQEKKNEKDSKQERRE